MFKNVFSTFYEILRFQPVENDDGGEADEPEHPEPEEDVDLLVKDVERQDAERVVLLQLPRAPELVESALG